MKKKPTAPVLSKSLLKDVKKMVALMKSDRYFPPYQLHTPQGSYSVAADGTVTVLR